MPIVSTDWSVDQATKDIRFIGDDHGGASPSYATVIEFHRWMQDLADDATFVGDDQIDITRDTPSDRSTDNIITLINSYNIDDNAAEHLYDGSIIQANGATVWDGIVNFGNSPQIQIIQNGAVLADDWWNSNGGLNSDAGSGISHRFMIKVRDGAVDIDRRSLVGTSRNPNKTASEFKINATARGNNVLALSESDDLNNQTDDATVATWSTIVNNTEGYSPIDVNGNGVNEFYYSNWTLGSQSINDLYERAKWLTRDGSAETIYGLPGELFRGITHEIDIDPPVGTLVEPEAVSWVGGTGQLLATDGSGKMWIQLLTGVAPADNDTITGGTSGATADVNVSVVERPVSIPFVGASTGSAIIGSYGLGILPSDLTASDQLFDLTNTAQVPPNNVIWSANGLVVGEDRILVGPKGAGDEYDVAQFALAAALTTDDITTVQMSTSIPSDTPSAGTIRVADDNGLYRRLSYSSWTTDTFIIASTDGNEDFSATNATTGNNAWISYIDKLAANPVESFTSVYNADRPLFVRVRDGAGSPIKTFQTSATLGSAGGSSTVIRTSDQ